MRIQPFATQGNHTRIDVYVCMHIVFTLVNETGGCRAADTNRERRGGRVPTICINFLTLRDVENPHRDIGTCRLPPSQNVPGPLGRQTMTPFCGTADQPSARSIHPLQSQRPACNELQSLPCRRPKPHPDRQPWPLRTTSFTVALREYPSLQSTCLANWTAV